MQRDRIIPGKWYQTKQGEGLCEDVNARGVKLKLVDGAVVWLKPNEVQFEIAEGEEPQVELDELLAEPYKPRPRESRPLESREARESRPRANKLDHRKELLEECQHGLSLAVHHLEDGTPITPASLEKLKELLAKLEEQNR